MRPDPRTPAAGRLLIPSRRRFLKLGTASLGALALGGCDIAENDSVRKVLASANALTYRAQRLLIPANQLAPEYPESAISAQFRANGTTDPQDRGYKALARAKFADWRLVVDGLVDHPLKLSLADLRALPARTQITRHDCVEGWSCIGQWTGAPLSEVLKRAGVKTNAAYAVFHCFDNAKDEDGGDPDDSDDSDSADSSGDGGGKGGGGQTSIFAQNKPAPYYESIDLVGAFHPQTILAYEMNGQPLTAPYGAPLRVRLERQLGYKMAKYLHRIELVDSFASIGDGKGGYWEDQGYDWYAGI